LATATTIPATHGDADFTIGVAVPRQHFLDLNLFSPVLQLGSYTGQILHWGFIPGNPWRNYLHTHSFFEVCFCFQGQGIFRIIGRDHVVGTGDVFVARPGEPHEIVADDEDPLGIYFWSYTLVPQKDRHPESRGTDALLRAFVTSEIKVRENRPSMQRVLELLTEEIAYREPGYTEVVKALVTKLVLDTSRAVVDVASLPSPLDPPARSTDEALVQTIVHYLRDNHRRPLCLRDVAAQVHLSERHCNRLFHAATGMSIMRFLTTLRMDVAAQLLLEREHSIKEVAQQCGYPDVHHFMTRFRQRTGLTPSSYRRTRGTVFLPSPAYAASPPSSC
jgi:AraC-like DNA-binding protein/quercetin dioxygenase-like cupin family protein